MVTVRDLWQDRSWDLADDEAVWRWAQDNCPSALLTCPKTAEDLLGAIGRLQNYLVCRLDQASEAIEVPEITGVFRAAQFLSQRDLDNPDWRAALVLHEGDLEAAALTAACVPVTPENRRALEGMMAVRPVTKAEEEPESGPAPAGAVAAACPRDRDVAAEVQDGMTRGDMEPLILDGRHSKGSWLVGRGTRRWLLKPGSGANSSAAGVTEESASQAAREAAFWNGLNVCGMGHMAPRAALVTIGGHAYAAISWLGEDWREMADVAEEDPFEVRRVLSPYLVDGTLHRLAALDFVLGQPDRHGHNVLMSGDRIQLIDGGSALAGDGFSPLDPNTFAPFYLREFVNDWGKSTPQQRLQHMPRVSAGVDESCGGWFSGINSEALAAVLESYGVMSGPTVRRMAPLTFSSEGFDVTVNRLWTLGP